MMNTSWNDFFVAILGAAAALTGLIFVGVSISLSRILSIPKLSSRAAESIILLVNVVVISALCLVPEQPLFYLAIEFLGIGTVIWIITFTLDLKMLLNADKAFKKHYRQNMLFTQLAILPYIVSGIVTLVQGSNGIYWLIPGIIFSFIKSVIDAWVLLVEINR
jgi:hypothetical protein